MNQYEKALLISKRSSREKSWTDTNWRMSHTKRGRSSINLSGSGYCGTPWLKEEPHDDSKIPPDIVGRYPLLPLHQRPRPPRLSVRQSFEHRKSWVLERLTLLADVFAIDVCAYAVMSNHYHLVLRVNTAQANAWSDREVAERWTKLFSGSMLVQRWVADEIGDAHQFRCWRKKPLTAG